MLQILDYRWHLVHSYRLHMLPAEFTFVVFRPGMWDVAMRPVPGNFVTAVYPEDLDGLASYDLALLHLDQWCDGHNLRALPYRLMVQIAQGIPKIVIMHGTPDSAINREQILRLIGDLPVVCNSFQAAREWDGGEGRLDWHGKPQFRTIIHGYNADEFWSDPLEQRRAEAITICSGGEVSRWYHGIPLIERLKRDVPLIWLGPRGDRDWCESYDEYREMLASTLIYFSPTTRAPMPGARTEAMLSGCCVVTMAGNDVERFIEHGKTGFIVHTYEEARDTLRALLKDPARAYHVGQHGRMAAVRHFDKRRFVDNWMALLWEVGAM